MKTGDIVYAITIPFIHSMVLYFCVSAYKLGRKGKWTNETDCDPIETIQLLDIKDSCVMEVILIEQLESKTKIERIFAFSESEIDQCKRKLINNNQKELQKQAGKFAELSFTIGE